MNRYARAACLALVLTGRPTAGLLQAAAPQVVVTPAGVTDELVLRDGTRAYGRVERIDGGLVTFATTAGAAIQVQAAEMVSIHPRTAASWTASFSEPIRIRPVCSSVRRRAR